MRPGLLAAFVFAAPAVLHAEGVRIAHEPAGCVVAGKFAVLAARFDPAGDVARARVYFRADATEAWYFVEMKPNADVFHATLPKPNKDLKRLNYYVEVLDKAANGSRTADFAPDVVAGASACAKGVAVAGFVGSASLAVGAAAGGPALPAGFSSAGVTSAAAGAGAAGPGGHTTLYVVGGVVTAAGVAFAASELVGTGSNISLEGHVFAIGPGGTAGSPIAGARVSTTLDSKTATTDASGAFRLVTSTPSSKGQGTNFTVTVEASGCQTSRQTANWGDHGTGQQFLLRCP